MAECCNGIITLAGCLFILAIGGSILSFFINLLNSLSKPSGRTQATNYKTEYSSYNNNRPLDRPQVSNTRPRTSPQNSNISTVASIIPNIGDLPTVAEPPVPQVPIENEYEEAENIKEKIIRPWLLSKIREERTLEIVVDEIRSKDQEINDLVIDSIDFDQSTLHGETFKGIVFVNCFMIGIDFSSAYFENVQFQNTLLTKATFHNAQLNNVQFIGCDLTAADFSKANVRKSQFNHVDLCQADFSSSQVQDCRFINSSKSRAINLTLERSI